VNRVRGRTAATAAPADAAACALWNPHATLAIVVYEISLFATTAPAAGSTAVIKRITARGTQTTTVTPSIENDTQRGAAPSSGAVLDLAYSAQPTKAADPSMWGTILAAVIGSGFQQPFPEGIRVPAGTGLAITAGAAVIVPVSDVSFAFNE
jgi:hypothetical protein